MTPRPPSCAMAMASPDSVTVSIAALSSGTFSRMFRVSRVETSTWVGSTVECCGTSRTSSKVSAVAMPISVSVRRQLTRSSVPCVSAPDPAPWHFLYFLPLPHGHGSFRPTFGSSRLTVLITSSPPVRAGVGACRPADGRRRPGGAGERRHRLRRRIVHRQLAGDGDAAPAGPAGQAARRRRLR